MLKDTVSNRVAELQRYANETPEGSLFSRLTLENVTSAIAAHSGSGGIGGLYGIDKPVLEKIVRSALTLEPSLYSARLSDRLSECLSHDDHGVVRLEDITSVLSALCRRDTPLETMKVLTLTLLTLTLLTLIGLTSRGNEVIILEEDLMGGE